VKINYKYIVICVNKYILNIMGLIKYIKVIDFLYIRFIFYFYFILLIEQIKKKN